MARDARNCIPQTIPPNSYGNQQRAQSDPVSYSQQGGLNEIPLGPRMLMPYLPKLAAKGQQIAGWLGMTDDWEEINLTNGQPRDHLQTLIERWLEEGEDPQAPHTLSFFTGVVRSCGKGKLADEMESKIIGKLPTLVLGGQGPMPQYSGPVGGPQQGYSQHHPYNSQWRRTSSPQVQNLPHSSPNLPHSSQSLPHSSQSLPHSSQNLPHSSQSLPHSSQSLPHSSQNLPHSSQNLPYSSQNLPYSSQNLPHSSQTLPHSSQNLPHSSQNLPYSSQNLPHSSLNLTHSSPNLPHSSPNLPHSSPNLPHSSQNLPHSSLNLPHSSQNLPHSSHSGQSFTPSGAHQPAPRMEPHEGMDFSTSESQPSLLTPVEESSPVTHQQMSSQYSGMSQYSGPVGGLQQGHYNPADHTGNPTLPYQRQPINPETSQPEHTTQHDEIQRDYSSTSFGQQQPSSFGMTNVQDTRKQLIETFLRLRRLLHHGELEADYGQNEGQRCVSAREEAEIFKSVFRIAVRFPESVDPGHGSGCFVEKKGSYWILTACHNLLNERDREKLSKGKRIEHLEEKIKEDLLLTSFILPDEQLELTREKHVVDVVGDISHVQLIADLPNDILAISCNNPEEFGGTSFQLKVDAMREYNPRSLHYVHIVHNPWKIAKHEDGDPNQNVQHSIGMIHSIRDAGNAMLYDNVTYSGSSGAPVFFAGYNGLILVGIHRKCSDWDRLNQGSHLTVEFVERMRAEAMQ